MQCSDEILQYNNKCNVVMRYNTVIRYNIVEMYFFPPFFSLWTPFEAKIYLFPESLDPYLPSILSWLILLKLDGLSNNKSVVAPGKQNKQTKLA